MVKDDKVKNGILGFIIGDAVGVPYEFKKREDIDKVEMKGYGTHNVEKGTWSDDSSMVIATMQSIIDNNGNINYEDIMNNFVLWNYKGEFTPNGITFDIGNTTYKAIRNYYYRDEFEIYKDPIKCGINEFYDNGNGSLMRILPIAYYCFYKEIDEKEIYSIVKNISSLTHSHNISIMGCYIYVLFVIQLLKGCSKESSYSYIKHSNYDMFDIETKRYYDRLLNNDISLLDSSDISGSGFVIDTLEAVIWSFLNSNSYKKSIINAVKLGDDTDTVGALVGALSGIYYNALPNEWLEEIKRREYLMGLCTKYVDVLDI